MCRKALLQMGFDLKLPAADQPVVRWAGLHGAALALYVARAGQRLPGPLLVLASDASSATRLEEEVGFFVAGQVPIYSFPDYETLPYDRFAPHPDIVSHRLRTLAKLPTLSRGIVISDLPTALQRIVPRTFVDAHALALRVGQDLDLEDFRMRLAAAGY